MNRAMQKLLVVLLMLVSTTAFSEPATKSSVKELMNLTGAGNLSVQMMNQMLPALKRMAPNEPQEFWDGFMAEVDPGEMEDMVIPIYQKYLTEAEIKELIIFYKSPTGEKLIQVQPNIMRESMMIGQTWGQGIAQRVAQKLREKQGQEQAQ